MSTTSLHELTFANEDVEPGAARVGGVRVSEGLSRPFSVTADLELSTLDVEPRAWLHKPAQIVVATMPDATVIRRYAGVVTAVRESAGRGATGSGQSISVTLEPPLALLRFARNRRIFQEKTTKEIVGVLLDEAGVSRIAWRLAGAFSAREVCMQFAETTLDFMSRILEEDGIFYFFEQHDDGDLLVFADAPSAFSATTPSDQFAYRAESGLVSEQAVTGLMQRDRVRPAKVTLRDHDFKHPALDLEVSVHDSAPLGREHYDFHGRYTDPAEGKRRAQIRLDAMAAAATVVTGTSTAFSLTSGHTIQITGAPDPTLDREWVVVSVESGWAKTGSTVVFSSGFELLPNDAAFRAPARAPRAVAPGPQVAIVTGPPGEEIHCDEFGRVKIHFHWDRESKMDDKSSCWVRVGQMHSSGSVAIPRVGWEVLIDFEDGDPDRPLLLGRVYNPASPPPYALPAKKTMSALKSSSTPGKAGYNEIRMDDGAGSEHIQVYSQKDHNLNVANNKTEKVATSVNGSVGANHKLTVGASETVSVGAQYGLDIGASQTWAVGASRTKTVSADEKITVKGSRTTTIGASHTTMTPMSVGVTTPASLSETVGGSCIEAAAMEVGIMAAGTVSVAVGGAKIEAVATGKSDLTVGARASTIGGAFISASGKDVATNVGGAKATTVGGAWAATAGANVELTANGNLSINVGGAVALTGASVVLKVGGSNVTLSGGTVVITSSEIKLTATGPQPELAPMVADK